jgi:succinoglycan biosynthesis protein ExoA
VSGQPRVTVVVPARNEARHIEACVRSILRQRVPGGLELLVVDGRSEDDTAEHARRAGALVLDNPARCTPAALNRGLAAAQGEVIVRFDAHGEMPDGYVAACLEALAAEGAANVGGWVAVEPHGPWGRALAVALASQLGVGNSRLWRCPPPGSQRRDVDSISFGCFRTADLRGAGGWSESFHSNQDFELNHRLRRAGGRVVFDPAVWSIYRPRESLRAIARQYWRYGRWKAVLLARDPRSLRTRQLAPPALLATVATAAVPGRLARPARTALLAYNAAIVVEALRARGGWRTPVVLTTMHLAWGGGLLAGLVRPPLRAAAPAAPAQPFEQREPPSP